MAFLDRLKGGKKTEETKKEPKAKKAAAASAKTDEKAIEKTV